MFYRYHLTIPAGTSDQTLTVQEFFINEGIIRKTVVKASNACENYVNFSIWLGSTQAFPSNPYEKFRPGHELIESEEWWPNKRGWHWYMVGSSPGSRYPHTVDFKILVLPEEVVGPDKSIEKLLELFVVTPEMEGEM